MDVLFGTVRPFFKIPSMLNVYTILQFIPKVCSLPLLSVTQACANWTELSGLLPTIMSAINPSLGHIKPQSDGLLVINYSTRRRYSNNFPRIKL